MTIHHHLGAPGTLPDDGLVICGTGHRDLSRVSGTDVVKQFIRRTLFATAPTRVISGMAVGFDLLLAEVALEDGMPLSAYVPFPGHDTKWADTDKRRLGEILDAADDVVYVCDRYSNAAYHIRNQKMVDASLAVISAWNGMKAGGTYQCLKYAAKRRRRCYILGPGGVAHAASGQTLGGLIEGRLGKNDRQEVRS